MSLRTRETKHFAFLLVHLLQFFLVHADSCLSPHVSGGILRSDEAVAVSCLAFLSTCEGLSVSITSHELVFKSMQCFMSHSQ